MRFLTYLAVLFGISFGLGWLSSAIAPGNLLLPAILGLTWGVIFTLTYLRKEL